MSSKTKIPNLRLMLEETREEEKRKSDGPMENELQSKKLKQIRIWVDGCFDMVHYGHANALRQAKSLGDSLIVGIHSDKEIMRVKGPPVLKEEERYKLVRAVKWVDEVIEDVPYVTELETIEKHNIDYCAHGDDITLGTDGTFSYQAVLDAGKFKVFQRTQGVSTTDLVGRMLLLTKNHFINIDEDNGSLEPKSPMKAFSTEATICSPFTGMYQFHPRTQKIFQHFSEGMQKVPKSGEKVVYVVGAFDLFHAGHVDFLTACMKFGTYIIIGVHDDQVVNSYKGKNYPIMNIQERVLGCLACRYVSDIVIGAPYNVTDDLLDFFKIDYVIHGETPIKPLLGCDDPYEAPKRRGIFRTVSSGSTLTATEIVMRIINNRLAFEDRNKKKEEKESKQERVDISSLDNHAGHNGVAEK